MISSVGPIEMSVDTTVTLRQHDRHEDDDGGGQEVRGRDRHDLSSSRSEDAGGHLAVHMPTATNGARKPVPALCLYTCYTSVMLP